MKSLNRRQFLKDSLIAGAGSLIFGSSAFGMDYEYSTSKENKPLTKYKETSFYALPITKKSIGHKISHKK